MGRRERQKEQRRRKIFEAAVGLFREKGYAATTIEDIAAAADIAKGTFFNYFPTKQAVLLHLNELQVSRLRAAVMTAPELSALSARERVRAIFTALAAGIEGQREMVRVVAAETLRSPPAMGELQQMINRDLDSMLAEIIVAGQASDEIRADVSADELARLLSGVYFVTIINWLDAEGADLAALLGRSLDLLMDGLRASN
jgi:AcrR family transcriptional regulator